MRLFRVLVTVLAVFATLVGVVLTAPPAAAADGSNTWVSVSPATTPYGTPINIDADVGDEDAPNDCSFGSCQPHPTGFVFFHPVQGGTEGAFISGAQLDEDGTRLETAGTGPEPYCCLLPGTYTIRGKYTGDSEYDPSSGDSNSFTVTTGPSITTIQGHSPSPSALGQEVEIDLLVSRANFATVTPTGTVDVRETIGSATVIYGTAPVGPLGFTEIKLTNLPAGSRNLKAVYSGDGNFNASESAIVSHVVGKAASTNTLSPSTTNAVFGQPINFTNTVAPVAPATVTPTGAVDLTDQTHNHQFGGALLVGGTVTRSVANLPVGTSVLDSRYGGDDNYNGDTSDPVTITVVKASSTTSLTSSPNPSTIGQPVTLTATVAPVAPSLGVPTGTVQFLDGGAPIGGPVALSGGQATLVTAALGGGARSLTAVYSGDAGFNGSTSPVRSHTLTCDRNITGTVNGPLVLGPGATCIANANVSGGVTIPAGARVTITGSTIGGAISMTGPPSTLLICGSNLNAVTSISGITGLLLLGDPANGCAANRFASTVVVSGNHGGVRMIGNSVGASLQVRNNDGGPIVVGGNRITGRLDCYSNNPVATNGGLPNTAMGRSGECGAAGF